MSAASIKNVVGKRFTELLVVDSTNNYAMQSIQKGIADHGDVYFAHTQTAGKGQRNNKWFSVEGESIICSVILNMTGFALTAQPYLNMAAALSACKLFNKYATENFQIKWPNDIYCGDRKAAGILIENKIRGGAWQFAVAGFGLNINQTSFPDFLLNPISLKLITGINYKVTELAKELCLNFNFYFNELINTNEKAILEKYNARLYARNEIRKFKKGSIVFTGMVKEADEFGRLIIENSSGEQAFESGTIEWLPG